MSSDGVRTGAKDVISWPSRSPMRNGSIMSPSAKRLSRARSTGPRVNAMEWSMTWATTGMSKTISTMSPSFQSREREK